MLFWRFSLTPARTAAHQHTPQHPGPLTAPARPTPHGIWQRLELVREEESPIAPIRRVFLGFTLLLLVLDVPLLLFISTTPMAARVLVLLAIVVLFGGYLRGDPHWVGHIPDSLWRRLFLSLYGARTRVAYQTVLYVMVLALGAAWTGPDVSDPLLMPTLIANVMSFGVLLSALLFIVARTLRRHHAAMAREQVITPSSSTPTRNHARINFSIRRSLTRLATCAIRALRAMDPKQSRTSASEPSTTAVGLGPNRRVGLFGRALRAEPIAG